MRPLLAACFALATSVAYAQTADAPLSTQTHPEEGEYIIDGQGLSLYLFEIDQQGGEGTEATSACEDPDCVAAWPPLVVGADPVADDGLDASLLGTMTRTDGTMQATYNGWPLYYYAGDMQPGDINGHDIEEFGGEWYLIGPDGAEAGEHGEGHEAGDEGGDTGEGEGGGSGEGQSEGEGDGGSAY